MLLESKPFASSLQELGAVSPTESIFGKYISAAEVQRRKWALKPKLVYASLVFPASGSTKTTPIKPGEPPVIYSSVLPPGSNDARIASALAKKGISTRKIEEEVEQNNLEFMPAPSSRFKSNGGIKINPFNKVEQMAANARARVNSKERQLRPSPPTPRNLAS